jgi:hypothetical protein
MKEGIVQMSYNTKNYFDDSGDTLVIGGKLIIEENAEVVGLPGGGPNTLPEASSKTLGGIKVGRGLKINKGVLSVDIAKAANQADSTATTVEALVADFNALIANLVAAGIMESAN